MPEATRLVASIDIGTVQSAVVVYFQEAGEFDAQLLAPRTTVAKLARMHRRRDYPYTCRGLARSGRHCMGPKSTFGCSL